MERIRLRRYTGMRLADMNLILGELASEGMVGARKEPRNFTFLGFVKISRRNVKLLSVYI
jgi:hypothetical protein